MLFASALAGLDKPALADPVDFDPRSTPQAPCGVGVPPPGHEEPGLRAAGRALTLTVRQDGQRLCYVSGDRAEAPVIRVRRGEPFSLTLNNEITDASAIDAVMASGTLAVANVAVPQSPGFYRVVPGMRHAATGATNLHVHGFAVPPVPPQDDVLTVCTDPATGPAHCGRRSYTYRYQVPATMPEGLYWYHPHQHGEVQAQMLMGLSGALVVEGPALDARRRAQVRERVLVVRQTQDQDAGKNAKASMTSAAPAASPAAERPAGPATAIDTAHELLCASSGGIDQLSLNGTPVPIEAGDEQLARLEMTAGARQYWQILNAATDAFLDLALVDEQGHALPMALQARDGSPVTDDAGRPLGARFDTAPMAVPPGGRIEIDVPAPPAGVKAYLVTHAVDTGCAGDRLPERRLAVVESVAADTAAPTASAPEAAAPAPRADFFSGLLARKTDRQRVIALAEYPRPGTRDETDFYIAERKPGAVLMPYMMNDPPAITVRAGTTEEWVIENWTHELHTFHIHQLHFRVLAVDGEPQAAPPLLDVVEVPYATATGFRSREGPVRPGRVRIKMSFPASMAGDIPFHCHLVDHEDNGMMAVLRILPPPTRKGPGRSPAERRRRPLPLVASRDGR